MPNDGYMDAGSGASGSPAAVPVPDGDLMEPLLATMRQAQARRQDAVRDAGYDLSEREQLRVVLRKAVADVYDGINLPPITEIQRARVADALLPRIREHVAKAVQAERERLRRVEALREYWDTHDPYRVSIHANQLRAALDGRDAAVPDAGDDTLREQLAVALDACQPAIRRVDLLLAVAREHTAKAELRADARARVDEIRQRTRAETAEAAIQRVTDVLDRWGQLGRGPGLHSGAIRAALDGTEATDA